MRPSVPPLLAKLVRQLGMEKPLFFTSHAVPPMTATDAMATKTQNHALSTILSSLDEELDEVYRTLISARRAEYDPAFSRAW